MLTPIAAFTLLPFVDVIRSPHPPGVRFALDSPLEQRRSNSPSHPERRRSKGRHIGPAYRFQFRSRALLRTPLFCGDLRYGTGRGEPSSLGVRML